MKIYTKTGDSGDTALFDGTRVSKAHRRVSAYGDIDELNAWLGLVAASLADQDITDKLMQIQRDLFALGSRLADPSRRIAGRVTKAAISDEQVTRLERWIDQFDEELPALRRFVLAGGTPAAAALHVARTVCRRAERSMVELGDGAFERELLQYVNRLSDLLFTMARVVNLRAGTPEVEW